MAMHFRALFFAMALSGQLAAQHHLPFDASHHPIAPDYSQEKYWAALPFHEDVTDMTPRGEVWIDDSLKQVDVFYIYPTLYSHGKDWNADIDNRSLNRRIDHYPVKYHASIFNHVGRVYVPRYRQAHIDCYSDTTGSGNKAFELAYGDLRQAFEYYMAHYNQGRPIILASHSQGTTHSRRLLKETILILPR